MIVCMQIHIAIASVTRCTSCAYVEGTGGYRGTHAFQNEDTSCVYVLIALKSLQN